MLEVGAPWQRLSLTQEVKNGQRVVTSGRLNWEIIPVCFHGKAALLLSNFILPHVPS